MLNKNNRRCFLLFSALKGRGQGVVQVVVADGGSRDATRALARRAGAKVRTP